uniref:26S proteasome regulatory subunit 4-like A n=8 Tax=Saliceae TaxID=238069 RepID=A0A4U5QT58_POPAL|nr:26S proteasome regulatory subunit 4-like A [Populus alba]
MMKTLAGFILTDFWVVPFMCRNEDNSKANSCPCVAEAFSGFCLSPCSRFCSPVYAGFFLCYLLSPGSNTDLGTALEWDTHEATVTGDVELAAAQPVHAEGHADGEIVVDDNVEIVDSGDIEFEIDAEKEIGVAIDAAPRQSAQMQRLDFSNDTGSSSRTENRNMGQGPSGGLNRPGLPGDRKQDGSDKKDKKFEPAAPPARVGRKQRKQKGPEAAARLPTVTPLTKCKLRLLKMERIKDYLLMEEEFVANQERLKPQEEKAEEDRSKVDDLRGSPMSVGNLEELIDENHAIVSSSVGPEYYVGILSFVDKDQLEPGCAILMHNKVLSVVGLLQDEVDPMVSVMKVEKAPLESYADIGGLDAQIQEIKEAVELPLTHPELYEDIGIKPPKGVILYGEPGTGKTLLAKAVANSTSATFLRVVGSELIQKYLGDGPKLVRELFRVADDLSPSIVFIDEIDAVGTKRYDAHSGGEREIQRTMLELLNQLDGFDSRGDVKVILATNRIESLDPALLRPGRIDRKIEFPLPDIKTRRRIFQIHTARMTLADDVNLEEFVMTKDEFSGADIKAICTEAGLLALRERRMKVTHTDFKKAKEKVMFKKKEGVPEGLYM